jgi:hypothetical protein
MFILEDFGISKLALKIKATRVNATVIRYERRDAMSDTSIEKTVKDILIIIVEMNKKFEKYDSAFR